MDCKLAHEQVEKMKALTYIDGVIVCNVLIEGTTYLGIMFKTLPQPVGSGARKLRALIA